MKLVGRIPVEPLDDERLTNIERRIVAGAADAAARQPVRESRMHLVLGFACVAVLVMGAGIAGWKLRGGADPAAIAATPVKVETTRESSTIDIGDARIASDPSTSFTVTRPDGGVLVTMVRGKVGLEVGKRGDRAPLVVRAGDTDVIVVGTRFTVDFGDGTGDVDVRVTEGVVKVVRHRKETRVAAGQAWQTDQGLVALAETGTGAGTAGSKATIGVPATGSGDIDIDIDVKSGPEVALHGRVATAPDVPVPATGATGSSVARPSVPNDRVRPTLDDPSDPRLDLKTAIRRAPVTAALEVGTTDPAQAISEYQKIMLETKGPKEAHAFYSMAVIQYSKLGRHADALRTLKAFEGRAQRTDYLVPALWLQVRIQCLQKLDGSCRAAAEKYLKHAPGGPAASTAKRITASQ